MHRCISVSAFPGGSNVKNLTANAEDTTDGGLIPALRRSLEEGMATHSSWLLPEKSHRERNLAGYRVAKTHT